MQRAIRPSRLSAPIWNPPHRPGHPALTLVAAGMALAGLRLRSALRSHHDRGLAARLGRDWMPSSAHEQSGPLALRLLGESGPPVVMLHGLGGSGRAWGHAYDSLGERNRLVLPDLLGFGRSARPATGYTLEAHADAVAASLDELSIDQPAVIVGHSFGALVAVTLARRRPELTSGLVLISPPIYRSASEAHAFAHGAFSRVERVIATPNPFAERLCRNLCGRRPGLAARVALFYRNDLPAEIARDGVLHSWESYSESIGELLAARVRPEWIAELALPVAILHGARDRLPDRALLEKIAATSPQIRFEVIDEADHQVPLAQPGRCLAHIERLLGEVA
ncbi:MAG: hypothetical protein NVSMB29_19820 [Candidatus Dormibacteria bacterium]